MILELLNKIKYQLIDYSSERYTFSVDYWRYKELNPNTKLEHDNSVFYELYSAYLHPINDELCPVITYADVIIYEENLNYARELESIALEIYKTYDKEIDFFEFIKKNRLEDTQIAEIKSIIDVYEFELLFGYGPSTQKGFRSRLNDSIPYIQKNFRCKIMYDKSKVIKWLEGKKR